MTFILHNFGGPADKSNFVGPILQGIDDIFSIHVMLSEMNTYVDVHTGQCEDLRRRMISGYVAIELVTILVPFDRVQRFAVQIVVTLQLSGCIANCVIGYPDLGQSQAAYDNGGWNYKMRKTIQQDSYNAFRNLFSSNRYSVCLSIIVLEHLNNNE